MSGQVRSRVLLGDDHRLVVEARESRLSVEVGLVGVVAGRRATVRAGRTLRPEEIVAGLGGPIPTGSSGPARKPSGPAMP